MKKGFSLVEVLLAIVIMGVVMAVVMPIIAPIAENNNKTLYKSAFKTVESVVSDIVSDMTLYPSGNMYNATDTTYFCNNFVSKLNLISTADCTTSTVPGTPNFITTNGMRWYGFNGLNFTSNATLQVDIDGQGKGKNTAGRDILRIEVNDQGKVVPPTGNETNYLLN